MEISLPTLPSAGSLISNAPTVKRTLTRSQRYQLYLDSPEWDELRKQCYARDGYRCTKCGSSRVVLQAHHVTYPKDIELTKISDLVTLCRKCHMGVHGIAKDIGPKSKKPTAPAKDSTAAMERRAARAEKRRQRKRERRQRNRANKIKNKLKSTTNITQTSRDILPPNFVAHPTTIKDIVLSSSARGGWTSKMLRVWGIGWPPRKGWMKKLIKKNIEIINSRNQHPNT